MSKKCRGCGIEIQFEDETKAGYVPQNVYYEREELVCKRCFQLKNYGQHTPVDMAEEEYVREVKKMLNETDVVLFIIDIIDFEGSFDKRIKELIGRKPAILCINKTDLIPGRKHPSEIAQWVKKQIGKSMNLLSISVMSVKSGYGVKGIIKKLGEKYKEGARVGVLGVTNVGKSSLINNFFEDVNSLTVSKYPGTTLKTIKRRITGTEFEIMDTPGLIPQGRISDMVCGECNLKLIPSREISRKTYKLKENKIFMFGGLVKIKILSNSDSIPIFVAFASEGVKFHTTTEDRADVVMKEHTGDWLVPPCNECKDDYYALPMKKVIMEIGENKDLVFKGLGWISVRRGPLKIEITMPEKAETVVRDAFIRPIADRNLKEVIEE